MWDVVPCPGVKPELPFHWAHGVLATGSPGTSQESVYTLLHVYDFTMDHQSWGAIQLILSVQEDCLTGSLCHLGRGYETLK